MFRSIVAAVLLAAPAAAAQATLLDSARAAYAAAWNISPLSVQSVAFVDRPAELIGDVVERKGAAFRQGENILIYAEPSGYAYIETLDGFEFGLDLDVEVLDSGGESLFRQEGFQTVRLASRRAVRELFLTMELELDGFDSGEYQIRIRANDIASDETAEFTLPFAIED